jgi:ABC-2 type transport system permease protein
MLASALGLYGASAIAAPGILDMGEVVRTALLLVPAVLVMMGLSVFLVGLMPKLSGLVWVLFGYSFMTVYFGPLMNLPEWMAKLSPFGHVPELAAKNISVMPIAVLMVIATALTFIGIISFRRRDVGGY